MTVDRDKNYGIEGQHLKQIEAVKNRLYADGDKPLTRGEIRDLANALDALLTMFQEITE
jgi:hypothetical protein